MQLLCIDLVISNEKVSIYQIAVGSAFNKKYITTWKIITQKIMELESPTEAES